MENNSYDPSYVHTQQKAIKVQPSINGICDSNSFFPSMHRHKAVRRRMERSKATDLKCNLQHFRLSRSHTQYNTTSSIISWRTCYRFYVSFQHNKKTSSRLNYVIISMVTPIAAERWWEKIPLLINNSVWSKFNYWKSRAEPNGSQTITDWSLDRHVHHQALLRLWKSLEDDRRSR